MAKEKGAKKAAGPASSVTLRIKKTPGEKVQVKTTTSKRAAAVEANMGGTQKLRDFLSGAGWD